MPRPSARLVQPRRSTKASERARIELVRRSHIFAAAVREELELRLLRSVSDLPLTLSQLHVLKLTTINDLHHVGEVARFLGVSRPAATKNVDKLERLGLVARRRTSADRRVLALTALPPGRTLVEKYEEEKRRRVEAILAEFSTEEVSAFSALLARFSLTLLRQPHGGSDTCLRCATYVKPGCSIGKARGSCPYLRIQDQPARRPPSGASAPRSA